MERLRETRYILFVGTTWTHRVPPRARRRTSHSKTAFAVGRRFFVVGGPGRPHDRMRFLRPTGQLRKASVTLLSSSARRDPDRLGTVATAPLRIRTVEEYKGVHKGVDKFRALTMRRNRLTLQSLMAGNAGANLRRAFRQPQGDFCLTPCDTR